MEVQKTELDSKLVNRLKYKIILAESTNLRTKNKRKNNLKKPKPYIKRLLPGYTNTYSSTNVPK